MLSISQVFELSKLYSPEAIAANRADNKAGRKVSIQKRMEKAHKTADADVEKRYKRGDWEAYNHPEYKKFWKDRVKVDKMKDGLDSYKRKSKQQSKPKGETVTNVPHLRVVK